MLTLHTQAENGNMEKNWEVADMGIELRSLASAASALTTEPEYL